MRIEVSGQQFTVNAHLQNYVTNHLEEGVKKYFERAVSAKVAFKQVKHLIEVHIHVNEGTDKNVNIQGQASATDEYAAFDLATSRVEKQLRRYHKRLKQHHKPSHVEADFDSLPLSATKYILSENAEEESKEDDAESSLIIAEKKTDIEVLSVSDAVMRMNLANLPALMFINRKTGRVNVVYHRKDGNISWVESDVQAVEKTAAPKLVASSEAA